MGKVCPMMTWACAAPASRLMARKLLSRNTIDGVLHVRLGIGLQLRGVLRQIDLREIKSLKLLNRKAVAIRAGGCSESTHRRDLWPPLLLDDSSKHAVKAAIGTGALNTADQGPALRAVITKID